VKDSQRNAVVLLSGGLDSTTVLAVALSEGYRAHALSFRYGQRHGWELEAARRVAAALGAAEHVVIDVDLRRFGGSALTSNIPVPKSRPWNEITESIPITYVPARNTIFLSFALAWAEVLGAADIFIGVNALDYSGYPDCRSEYIDAFEGLANLATKAGVEGHNHFKINAPLIRLSKAKIIKLGLKLGVDYSVTSSCYDPSEDGEACGYRQCTRWMSRRWTIRILGHLLTFVLHRLSLFHSPAEERDGIVECHDVCAPIHRVVDDSTELEIGHGGFLSIACFALLGASDSKTGLAVQGPKDGKGVEGLDRGELDLQGLPVSFERERVVPVLEAGISQKAKVLRLRIVQRNGPLEVGNGGGDAPGLESKPPVQVFPAGEKRSPKAHARFASFRGAF